MLIFYIYRYSEFFFKTPYVLIKCWYVWKIFSPISSCHIVIYKQEQTRSYRLLYILVEYQKTIDCYTSLLIKQLLPYSRDIRRCRNFVSLTIVGFEFRNSTNLDSQIQSRTCFRVCESNKFCPMHEISTCQHYYLNRQTANYYCN